MVNPKEILAVEVTIVPSTLYPSFWSTNSGPSNLLCYPLHFPPAHTHSSGQELSRIPIVLCSRVLQVSSSGLVPQLESLDTRFLIVQRRKCFVIYSSFLLNQIVGFLKPGFLTSALLKNILARKTNGGRVIEWVVGLYECRLWNQTDLVLSSAPPPRVACPGQVVEPPCLIYEMYVYGGGAASQSCSGSIVSSRSSLFEPERL